MSTMCRLWSILVVAIVATFDPATAQSPPANCVSGQVDLLFVIDASNSIGFGNFRKLKTFLQDFLNQTSINNGAVRVGAVSFSTTVDVEFLLNRYSTSAEIIDHINKLKYLAGATNTAEALSKTRDVLFKTENGDRPEVANFVIVITDGKSNLNSYLTIPNAKQLRDDGVLIYALAIGRELEESPEEIKAMVSEPAEKHYNFITDYADLITLQNEIFKKICPVIEEKTVIQEGSPCTEEGKVVEKRCRTFKCINKKWSRIGFTGCIHNGRCYQWDQGKEDGCYKYKCFKAGDCKGNLCPKYDMRLIDAGCLVDGQCISQNQIVEDKKSCSNYQCLARTDKTEVYSEYVMVSKECMGADGNCRAVGYKYEEHCVQYECQVSQFYGIMQADFVPINVACKHGSECIPFGARVKEACDVYVCNYDDKSMGYELMLESQGCAYNGECLKKDEKRFQEKTCSNFVCSYSKKENRLVLKERVAGCKGTDGSCSGKGDVSQKGCIKYQCDNDGNFQLIEAGCEEAGQCKPVNSVWRRPGTCAEYKCVMGQSDAGSVTTNIEESIECHDINGNCLKPGNTFVDHCKTFRCKSDGQLERIDAKCEYDDKCYETGSDWIDKKRCLHVFCRADPQLGAVYNRRKYGCKDENGKCYAPEETYTLPGSCIRYKCSADHIIRKEVCEYKDKCYEGGENWIDLDDCLAFSCYKDEYTGEANVATTVYGCMEEGLCRKPGDTYVKNCQTYQCMSGLLGFKIVDSQCPWKDGCKKLNQTWFDKKTCRKYGCLLDSDGLDIEEITYGCRGLDNECIKDSKEVVQDQCIKYDCKNGDLIPKYIGCEFEGRCLDLNKFELDEAKCIKYTCVMSDSGNGFVATKIKEIRGCLDHDKCYMPGDKKQEDCSTLVCTADGTFSMIDPQCEYKGKCVALNKTWDNEEKCKKYQCIISKKSGMPMVKTWVWGCRGTKKCYPFGAKKRLRKCVVHECQKTDGGPKFVPFKIGCPSGPNGRKCKPLDKSWINTELCVRETCGYEEGNMYPEIFQSPYGCFDHEGVCKPFGAKLLDDKNPCVKYECSVYGSFTPIEAGCPWDGKCKTPGSIWEDQANCMKYRCEQENVGASKVIMHVVEIPGCRDTEGKCMNDGESKRIECTDYLCDTSRGGLVITGEGCMNWGECKPKGSTWLDPASCITYQCQYDDNLKDLFIVEKQLGCQDDKGACFNKGEKKLEECNKFVCNAKGNFQVTKAGCARNEKCYNIDESWKEGCIMFTCVLLNKGPNFVETKIVERHGCIDKNGECLEPLQKYKDGCIEYECQVGGQLKQTNFGCIGFNKECVLPGKTVEDDCNKYHCDPYSLSLQPVDMGCRVNGICKEINSTWFVEETCLGYRCVYDPETNDVDIIERIHGCQVDGQCIRPGERKKGKDCVSYKCKDGKMVPIEIGCEYNGGCIPLNEVVKETCAWKTCVIAEQGSTFIDTRLITEHGCWDCFHKCHRVGDKFTQGCKVTECMAGGFSHTIQNKCMTPSGVCINFGEKYIDYRDGRNITYTCGEVGDLVPVQTVHKCKQALSNKLYDVGAEIESNCVVYRCTVTLDSAEFVPVLKKCMDNSGSCHVVGESWADADCNKYRCDMEKGNPYITISYGCKYNGACFYDGQTFPDADLSKCVVYQCLVKMTNTGVLRSRVVYSGGCMDDGACHKVDEIWKNNKCVQKKCTSSKNGDTTTYAVEILNVYCQDIQGKCRDNGESGFEAQIGPLWYYGCTCVTYPAEKRVEYKCKGAYP